MMGMMSKLFSNFRKAYEAHYHNKHKIPGKYASVALRYTFDSRT